MTTVADLAKLVQVTRNAQKDYFATRTRSALELSKNLERKLDRVVLQVLGEQASQGQLMEVGDAAPARV